MTMINDHKDAGTPDEAKRGPSDSQLAAVVEAAYILEALRK
jgi:hypothetical protein